MQEFEQKLLEQYDVEVNSTRKVRGAVLCETNKGLFLLKEVTISEKRIPALLEIYTYLYDQGNYQIDYMIKNCDGVYISTLDNGNRYILKKWSAGRECDIKKTREIYEAVRNLAKLHIFMSSTQTFLLVDKIAYSFLMCIGHYVSFGCYKTHF